MTLAGIRPYGWPRVEVFSAHDLTLKPGDACIVEGENGLDYGEVIFTKLPVDLSKRFKKTKKIIRLFNDGDKNHFRKKILFERKAFEYCMQKCDDLKVPLKLVRVHYCFDFKKSTFYYTAAGRIDFRQLVKELARGLHLRVEMRQIGVRDEAKMIPGVGTCGKALCCSTFLGSFKPVSMKMAKQQNLVLNPAKLSGVCGRLKCCLAYEFNPKEKSPPCNNHENEI